MRLNLSHTKKIQDLLDRLKEVTGVSFEVEIDVESQKLHIPFLEKKLKIAILEDDLETILLKCQEVMKNYVKEVVKTEDNFKLLTVFWEKSRSSEEEASEEEVPPQELDLEDSPDLLDQNDSEEPRIKKLGKKRR